MIQIQSSYWIFILQINPYVCVIKNLIYFHKWQRRTIDWPLVWTYRVHENSLGNMFFILLHKQKPKVLSSPEQHVLRISLMFIIINFGILYNLKFHPIDLCNSLFLYLTHYSFWLRNVEIIFLLLFILLIGRKFDINKIFVLKVEFHFSFISRCNALRSLSRHHITIIAWSNQETCL